MEIGFSPFATRPAKVESADDWLGEPRDSSLRLDGPVGTPAFPVQRRADDLLRPAEESHEETRATLPPEAHGEAMGEAYGLFTEGLEGGPAAAAGEVSGQVTTVGDGSVSGVAGDGGHANGAPSGDNISDLVDDVDDAGDDGDAPPWETPDDVADMMDAPAAFEESRATIIEDELDEADGFDLPSIDGVADVMDAPAAFDETRATIIEEPAAGVNVDADRFEAPDMDGVADVMDAPAEFDERRAPLSAVQAKSAGMVGSAPDIQSVAAEGVQGGGGRLPHLDKIQAAFGDHDVSGVAAHTGGKAATAARAIGASAYATGNDVAFAQSPDLFTAAHEAAHVVQQRGGVQLLGGVGDVGDSYEQNADAVADAVVRGASASHLLSASPRPGASIASAVQKRDDYLGSSESLARDGASHADDDQVRGGMLGTRRDMATLDPADATYSDRQQNLAVMQSEAARRGIRETAPSISADEVVHIAGVALAPDATYMRYALEQQVGSAGFGNGQFLVGELDRSIAALRAKLAASNQLAADQRAHDDGVAAPVPAGVPLAPTGPGQSYAAIEADITLRTRIRDSLTTQLAVIESDNAAFVPAFEAAALAIAYRILDDSEARVTSEMQRYGMTVDRSLGLSGAKTDNSRRETKGMQQAAKQLLASARVLESAQKQAVVASLPASLSGGDAPDTDAADASVSQADYAHAQLRVVLEAKFPALARYESVDALEDVTKQDFGTKDMAWDLDENLVNIAKTRTALGRGQLSVFRLPQVVASARESKLVVSGSMRDRLVNREVSAAKPSAIKEIAISVIALGLGIVSMAATGGASAPALAAQGVAVALDVGLAYQAVQQYQVDKAASGTDPDRARALAKGEPSLFWLGFQIVSMGLVGADATGVFRGIVKARQAALAAKEAEAVADQLRELRRLSRTAQLSDDAESRLVAQVVGEHPVPEAATEAEALLGRGSTTSDTSGGPVDDMASTGRNPSAESLHPEVPSHSSARLGEPPVSELKRIRSQYPGAESVSEQRAVWLVEQVASTKRVVAGERQCARLLNVPEGENMVDLVRINKSGLKVPTEVKNQTEVHLAGRGNAAFNKFEAIANHTNMAEISHFEVLIHTDSVLQSNFRVTKDGTLERMVSGTPNWEVVTFGGKKVKVVGGGLGRISVD